MIQLIISVSPIPEDPKNWIRNHSQADDGKEECGLLILEAWWPGTEKAVLSWRAELLRLEPITAGANSVHDGIDHVDAYGPLDAVIEMIGCISSSAVSG
jgi:hypothetical protein